MAHHVLDLVELFIAAFFHHRKTQVYTSLVVCVQTGLVYGLAAGVLNPLDVFFSDDETDHVPFLSPFDMQVFPLQGIAHNAGIFMLTLYEESANAIQSGADVHWVSGNQHRGIWQQIAALCDLD